MAQTILLFELESNKTRKPCKCVINEKTFSTRYKFINISFLESRGKSLKHEASDLNVFLSLT